MSPAELHRRQRAQRRLTIARTADGMIKATALMDPATGAAFRAVIDDVAQRFSEVDKRDQRPDAVEPRSYAQCRLDALVALIDLDATAPAAVASTRRKIDSGPNYATSGEPNPGHRWRANTSPICLRTSRYLNAMAIALAAQLCQTGDSMPRTRHGDAIRSSSSLT